MTGESRELHLEQLALDGESSQGPDAVPPRDPATTISEAMAGRDPYGDRGQAESRRSFAPTASERAVIRAAFAAHNAHTKPVGTENAGTERTAAPEPARNTPAGARFALARARAKNRQNDSGTLPPAA